MLSNPINHPSLRLSAHPSRALPNRRSPGIVAALFLLALGLSASAQVEAQVKTVDQLKYSALPETPLPTPTRHVLANGMVVMLLEDHELPLISLDARIRTGSRWEPADKVGLAALTGEVLRSGGTQKRPSQDLDDYLEDKAAKIETAIGMAVGTASMSALRDDFPEVLAVFAEVLRTPAFEAEQLEVAKNQEISSIARQNDDAGDIVGREFRKRIYGPESPYARTSTYATINAIERADLVAWHARYFHPNRILLGLVGDFDSAAALRLIEQVFGDWPRGPEVVDPPVPYLENVQPGVYFASKNDVTQSYIRVGHLGILRSNPDYYAVEVMNQALGGSFSSRLFNRVRSKQGLAYDVFGRVASQWDYPGVFLLAMSTKTETTAAGIASLLTEARNMTTEPLTDLEVENAKAAILNSFVFTSDSTREILGQQLSYEYYGYPLDWLARYQKGIIAVTTADVTRVASKYIRPQEFAIVVVGPEAGQDRPLSEFGEIHPLDITIPEPEMPKVALTAAGKARADELLARAVAAVGGAEQLAQLQSLEILSEVKITTPQGEMTAETRTLMVFPDRLRQELKLPFGTMVQVLAEGGGFQQTPRGAGPMPDSRRIELTRSFARHPVVLLKRQATSGGFTAVASGNEEVNGKTVEQVQIELSDQTFTLGIDPESGQVLSLTYRGTGILGEPGEVREVYSDFRSVNGLQLPFAEASTLNGQAMMRAALRAVTVNGQVDANDFVLPSGGQPSTP